MIAFLKKVEQAARRFWAATCRRISAGWQPSDLGNSPGGCSGWFVCTTAVAWASFWPLSATARTEPVAIPGTASPVFSLRMNGIAVPVLAYKDIHFAQTICAGPAQVEVSLTGGQRVETASVHPLQFGIKATAEAAQARFTLPRPMKLVLQINFLPKLFLFVEPPEAAAPPGKDAPVTDAIAAGARPDGITDSTAAIQRAIDALPKVGVLIFPPGHYRSGSLRMRSDTTLHLAAGALLQAADEHEKIRFPLTCSG